MARLSVIVPVYNKRDYLSECLESLCSQTLRDIEVICVDDGSTDGSDVVLRDMAAVDRRLRVIRQENAGPCVARNTGMARATGDVLMFVDADDALVPDACEFVDKTFGSEGCDVLTFGFNIVPPEATHPSIARHLRPRDVTFDAFEPRILFAEDARPFAARTAISSDFARRQAIRWEPGLTLGDDQFFHFEIYPRSRRTTLRSRQLYLYRMAAGSITHAGFVGKEALLDKLSRHLDCEVAIARDWDDAGFMQLCPDLLLEWCIELLLKDASSLDAEASSGLWRRFAEEVACHFDLGVVRGMLRPATRTCFEDALSVAKGVSTSIPVTHVARFYLARRGLLPTIRRVLYGMRHEA